MCPISDTVTQLTAFRYMFGCVDSVLEYLFKRVAHFVEIAVDGCCLSQSCLLRQKGVVIAFNIYQEFLCMFYTTVSVWPFSRLIQVL